MHMPSRWVRATIGCVPRGSYCSAATFTCCSSGPTWHRQPFHTPDMPQRKQPPPLACPPTAMATPRAVFLLTSTCLAPRLQLRKVFRVLPAALARDQPGAAVEAAACLGSLPEWDIQLLSSLEPRACALHCMISTGWAGWFKQSCQSSWEGPGQSVLRALLPAWRRQPLLRCVAAGPHARDVQSATSTTSCPHCTPQPSAFCCQLMHSRGLIPHFIPRPLPDPSSHSRPASSLPPTPSP